MSNERTENNSIEIDAKILLTDLLRGAKQFWMLGVVLVVLCAGLMCFREYRSYSPVYEATASFTVYVTNPLQAEIKSYNASTAEQMAKTFPHIISSGALHDLIMQELELPYMPSVKAKVMNNTNIFTLSVTSGDPELAYNVLNAVIEYYPEIAEFVVGPTRMYLLDESGIPAQPMNKRDITGAIRTGAVLGAGLWLVILLLFAYTRATIHNSDELKKLINLRCVGTLPFVKGFQKRAKGQACPLLNTSKELEGFSESVRLIRIRVERALQQRGKKVLLVSSAIPGEGKTTTATNLALAFAQKGKKTLLIDCDLRNPSVAKVFGKEKNVGLPEYLAGTANMLDIMHSPENENFFVVFGGAPITDSVERLSSDSMRKLVQASRSVFDYIVLDTPPCTMLSDAADLAELADCALLTIRQNHASKYQILEGAQFLADSGVDLIGCVFNGVRHGSWSGSYGYYGYGKGYKDYAADSSEED